MAILTKPEEQAPVSDCGERKKHPVLRYIPASNIDNDIFLLLWWLRYQHNIAHNKFLSLFDKAVNGNMVNVQIGPEKSNQATSKIMMM